MAWQIEEMMREAAVDGKINYDQYVGARARTHACACAYICMYVCAGALVRPCFLFVYTSSARALLLTQVRKDHGRHQRQSGRHTCCHKRQ